MKSYGYYKTVSALKQADDLVDSLLGYKINNSKVRQYIVRDMKREYRLSRPKKTRYNYEIKRLL